MDLFTIGHSNHPIARLMHLIEAHAIKMVADVRSTPYSRFNPQYNQPNLKSSLSEQGIAYAYLGDSLGGRPRDPGVYIHHTIPRVSKDFLHEVNYTEIMQRPWFIQGIEQLLELARIQTTVILCSEGDPAKCHRHLLIARYLLPTSPHVNILHILRVGSILNARAVPSTLDDSGTNQTSFLKP